MTHRAHTGSRFPQLTKKALSLLLALAMLCGMMTPALAFVPPTDDKVESSLANGYSDNPSAYEIYPVPHHIAYPTGDAFTMTKTVNAVIEDGIDRYTVAFLEEILAGYGMTMTKSSAPDPAKTNILLGIEGSGGAVDTAAKDIPLTVDGLFTPDRNDPDNPTADRLDAYLLTADASENANGVITILGRNTDCAYYGLATLQMMFSSFAGKRFLPVHIEDYSNVVYRGFIEGFYGVYENPYPERESQIRSIRDVKGNIYVFAAKGDAYHGSRWAELYPEEELNQIKHLVEVGLETKVAYAWSVHIGQGSFFKGVSTDSKDDPNYQTKLAQLKAKFQQLYNVGVRNFHILNDDTNSGTNQQVINLLNDMNAWRKEKGCRPIIYCCKGYNTSWAGNGAELVALKALDPDIYLYWTGADVNTPITQQNVDFPREKSNHYPVTWLNYPCSEHAGSVPLLGSAMYYLKDANNLQNHKGIISNPVRNHSEATKIAFFQLLSWGWNRDDYNSYADTLWEDCFKYLQPEVYYSYLTLAKNISNAPKSGRIPNDDRGFPESEDIKAALTSVQGKILSNAPLASDAEVTALIEDLKEICAAVDDFNARCDNPTLIRQLAPWTDSLKSIVQSAIGGIEAAIALQGNDLDGAWAGFSVASTSLAGWNARVADERGGGSKRIRPFADKVLGYVTAKITPLLNPGGMTSEPSFYAVLGGSSQADSAESAKIFDGNLTTVAAYNVTQRKGDYYGIDLGSIQEINGVSILQGTNNTDHDYFHQATLECSRDGENWVTLAPLVDSRSISVSDLSLFARYVRLRLMETGTASKPDYWTHIREFAVDVAAGEPSLAPYTNLSAPPAISVTENGGVYTMAPISSLTLADGEYVGLKLPEIMGIKDVALAGELPQGLTLQHSANGVVWTDGAPSETVSMRYLRIFNGTKEPVTAALPGVSGTASESRVTGSFVSSNTGSLAAGTWANVFDGDPTTFAQNNKNQAPGDYFVFDLGARQPIHDIKLYSRETGDTMYYLDVSLGDANDPNGAWTTVGTIDNNARIEPPYRVFNCDGGGMTARYLKLKITQAPPENKWIAFNEIEINKAYQQETSMGAFSGTPLGKFEAALDNNLSTFLAPGTIDVGNSYFQYLLSENTRVTSINILQSPTAICNAAVKVLTASGWQSLGKLDAAAKIFATHGLGDILAVRLDWVKGSSPAIAEIILQGTSSGGSEDVGQIPLPLPNIYLPGPAAGNVTVNNDTPLDMVGLPTQGTVTLSSKVPVTLPISWSCPDYDATTAGDYVFTGSYVTGDAITNPGGFALTATVTVKRGAATPEEPFTGNLALNSAVIVSGTEIPGEPPANTVDGNSGTRWSAFPKMKERDDMTAANQTQGVEWIVVDLNKDKDGAARNGTNLIDKVTLTAFSNKAWGTKYDILVSNDGETYTLAKSCIWDAKDAAGGVQENIIESAVSGRYVKIVFNEMNIYAKAANSVSIAELNINGTKTPEGSGGEVGDAENLALVHPVYVSGTDGSGANFTPEKAVDGADGTHFSTNGMKTPGQAVDDSQTPSWIVVDLGDDVAAITEIKVIYNGLVWPTDYLVQFSSTYSGEDFRNQNAFAEQKPLADGTITGDHAPDGELWTTVSHVAKDESSSDRTPTYVITPDLPIPDGSRYIRLYFNRMNTPAAGHAIGLKELTVTGNRSIPEVPPADPNVVSVAAVTAASIVGTDFAALNLPQRVVVSLADGTTAGLSVSWSSTGYDSASTEPQSLTGTLTLPSGITNTGSISAAVTVTLSPLPNITSAVVNPTGLMVELGTDFSALPLPAQAVARLDNGLSTVCSIVWDGTGYDPSLLGTQVIYGELTHPDNISNTKAIQSAITLTVRNTKSPTNLRVTAYSTTTATLAWNPPMGAGTVGYTVLNGDDILATVSVPTTTVTGLTPGTDYTLRLTSQDADGNSSFAATVTFTTTFMITTHAGIAVSAATVKLLQGETTVTSATTAVDGGYHFTGEIAPGVYTLTVTYEDITVTYLLNLAPGENPARNITLPEKRIDTTITVDPTLPAVGVDGMNEAADSLITPTEAAQGAKLSLAVAAANRPEQISAINSTAQGHAIAIMLALDLTKTVGAVNTPVSDTQGTMLTVALPLAPEHQGKENYVIYRYHDGKVDTITTSETGERLEVFDTYLLLRLSKFSTYAVAYGNAVVDTTPSYQVKATSTEGGTITPTSTRVSAGSRKTFTITPNQNYAIASLTLDGVAVPLTELTGPNAGGAYTYVLKHVRKAHTLHVAFDMHHLWEDFADIDGHWALDSIKYVTDAGLVTGTSKTTFSPNLTTSRAMVVTILYRLAGMPASPEASAPFADVPAGLWYSDAVAWASENALANGVGNNRFAPEREVSRQELITLLFRYAEHTGMDVANTGGTAFQHFSDADNVASWAAAAMAWSVEKELIAGKTGNRLVPNAPAVRAELAVILQRFAAVKH